MCYFPVKVGEDPGSGTMRDWMVVDDDKNGRIDSPYDSWVDKNHNNKRDKDEPVVGDFQLMHDMGCNTIRIYHSPSASPKIQKIYEGQSSAEVIYRHPPNKQLLRDLFNKYGIRVAMGNLLGAYAVGSAASYDAGTDYTDSAQLDNMMATVEDMVKEYKDEPFLLMWVLGNENNYAELTHTNASKNPAAYAQFVERAAKRIKQLDPHHPVALCNGETQLVFAYAKYAPSIDIFGVNSYRMPTFGSLWQQISRSFDRPVMLTEFGLSYPKIVNGVLDQEHQAMQHRKVYCDIVRHSAGQGTPGNAIGGFVFEWLDNWWQNGDIDQPNLKPSGWNNEINGMAGQGNGKNSPFLRDIRKVYFTYQALWTDAESCSQP